MALQFPDKRGDLGGGSLGESSDWSTRIRPGQYTSPSGKVIAFEYEGVSREIDLRRAVFEFSGVDGVYIQQHGTGTRRYPLRCYFSGPTCDLEATAFEAALCEPGVGQLQHPLYSSFPVIPMGTIRRTDNLVGELNQSVVEVEFWPSLPAVYPTLERHPANEILAALGNFNTALAQGLADGLQLSSPLDRAGAKSSLLGAVSQLRGATRPITRTIASAERQFLNLQTTFTLGIDDLLDTPETLCDQLSALFAVPAEIVGQIQDQINAFIDAATAIMGSDDGDPESHLLPTSVLGDRVAQFTNAFRIADTMVMASTAAAVRACATHTFTTRPEALQAAADVVDQYETVAAWRDAGFAAIDTLGVQYADQGGAIQALDAAVALCAGELVRASFTLYPEIRIVLDRPRTIIDLAGQLFAKELQGAPVDSKLDELILTNNLSGDEILELPAGREIVYYRKVA